MRCTFGGACWWSAVKAPVCVLLSTLKLPDFIVYHITKEAQLLRGSNGYRQNFSSLYITSESINDGLRWHDSSYGDV
ncbi:hypothetical protein Bca52824_088216 [Brassica carinata]|uniref:Secreted protein n=1 Tax=Brassica carinata TaxID=52824 RepID=A0A8X7PDQ6_BRACI|nr:hypothetical protein Bca52824_088216 [Brassica carinata]